ncbi:MAG: hypothetical protein RBQ91_01025 [Acholeplasma sp.]|nr:hypothetical protein [Acholeplasma sp.]
MSKLKNNPDKNNGYNPYGIDKLSNVKPSVKIGFMKFWLSGAVFFLSFTALSASAYDVFDRMVFLFLLLGLGIEYIMNKVIIWMNNDNQPTLKYLPFHLKRTSIFSLLASMGYAAIMILSSYFLIEWIMSIGIPSVGMIMFGFDYKAVDPISFGLIYWLMDFIWISTKNYLLIKFKK